MKNDQQSLARDLYFNTNKTQQEIADILDVNRRTVYLWIKQGRWEEMKAAARQMPSLIQQSVYNHFSAVNDQINKRDEDNRCPTMQEVEKMRKLLNMANSVKKQHTGAYMEVFQELYQFVFNRDSEFAKQLSVHIQAFTRGTIGDKEFTYRRERKQNVLDVTANLAKEEQRNYQEQEETQLDEASISSYSFSEGSPLANNIHATQCNTDTVHNKEKVCGPDDYRDAIFCDKNIHCHPEPVEGQALAKASFIGHSFSEGSSLANDISAQETRAEQDKNGIFCDKNAISPDEPAEGAKPFRIKDYVDGPCPIDDEKYPIPEDFDFDSLSFLDNGKEELTFEEVMQLPIAFRPTPFMDGDTVWVKEMDDVESPLNNFGTEWGILKMGHTVRRYPDIDSAQAA